MLWIEWPSVKFARPKGFLGLRTFSATTGIVPGTQGWLERERERELRCKLKRMYFIW